MMEKESSVPAYELSTLSQNLCKSVCMFSNYSLLTTSVAHTHTLMTFFFSN